jgi:hypothetical protein
MVRIGVGVKKDVSLFGNEKLVELAGGNASDFYHSLLELNLWSIFQHVGISMDGSGLNLDSIYYSPCGPFDYCLVRKVGCGVGQ